MREYSKSATASDAIAVKHNMNKTMNICNFFVHFSAAAVADDGDDDNNGVFR